MTTHPQKLFIATGLLFCAVIASILLDLPMGWYFPLLALAAGLLLGEPIVLWVIYKMRKEDETKSKN
jgi:uncharacterized membrane protein AbrB (regulator of aidB expression)